MADDRERRFEEIFRDHFRAVLGYALVRTNPDDARDVVAETFLVVWRRLEDVPKEPRAWLLGVARRVLAGQRRGAQRRDALSVRLSIVRDDVIRTTDPSIAVSERDTVMHALDRLSDSDREILQLVAWDGVTPAVGAGALGITTVSFAVRFHRARRRFAAALAASEPLTAPHVLSPFVPTPEATTSIPQSKEAQ